VHLLSRLAAHLPGGLATPHRLASRGPQAMFHPQATPHAGGRPPRVLFVSGEPDTPGHHYRVVRYAAAAAAAGYAPEIVRSDALPRSRIVWACRRHGRQPALVVIWRAVFTTALARAIRTWRRGGARILFDVDDYMFDPALARSSIIDGIRSQAVAEEAVAEMYARVNQTFMACDAGIAPTEPLAHAMRRWGKPAYVMPNGFDEQTLQTSRRAVAARRRRSGDGLVRLGYAAGSRTHQQDFAMAAPAVARVLRERPQCRLVLFRSGVDGPPLVDLAEYPEFVGLDDRIEWRPLRPLAELPEELARFDVNLAPLETGNPFCEAKSELKFFEAALVEVCTIASPTAPFAAAILPGRTGLLARDTAEWQAALRSLVDDPGRRRTMGQAAYHAVLWAHGPDGRRETTAAVYGRLLADPAGKARAFEATRRRELRGRRLPEIPQGETLFRHETGTPADVAVVIPCHNYARYVGEALDSVAAQTGLALELIVVDDGSTDDSVEVVGRWMRRRASRFARALHLRNLTNSRLSLTRNAGFAAAEAGLVFPLDADNTLAAGCLATLRRRLLASGAAAAHPTIERFGGDDRRVEAPAWDPDRLRHGNYIDAMALIRTTAWSHVGGYETMPLGWEDYDLWCLFVEAGLWSVAAPEATARYRVHGGSMLHAITDLPENRRRLAACLHARHPWLDIPLPPDAPTTADTPAAHRRAA
jgi:glycosyltransferase involved in cell wall biosynthesis/GT2 family glycosyltransferase